MFSIGDDELDVDLDDEEFLLAACGIPQAKCNDKEPTASKSNTIVDNNLIRKPLASVSNSFTSTENSCGLHGDRNLQRRPSSQNSSTRTFQSTKSKVNSNSSNGKNCELAPPCKRIATNDKDSLRNCPERISNISNFSHSRNKNNIHEGNSLHTLSKSLTTNYNFCSPSRTASHLNTTSSSNNTRMRMSTEVSPRSFQTPVQINEKQKILNTPKDKQEYQKTSSHDVVDVTPSRRKSCRKFPGPAGLLPKLSSSQSLDELSLKLSPAPSTSRISPNNMQRPVSSSQSQATPEDEEFSRDPWIGMINEYQQNVPALMRYTILQVFSEAARQCLKYGKVPSLCVLVKTSAPTETDASILLKDPTGEIHGTLHKKVLEEYPSELGPGAGIILKQVSVFSPSPRKHYLNITPGNIIHIYPPDPSQVSSSQPLTTQGSQSAKQSSQERPSLDEPDIILESQTSDDNTMKESTNLEAMNDLLEGLVEDDNDILDEDLLAMY